MELTNNKNKMKKIISTISLVCIGVSALIGLGLLFKILELNEFIGKLMLSILTVFVVGICLMNAIDSIVKKNKFGIATIFMVLISSILVLIWIWLPLQKETILSNTYSKVVIIVSMVSIMLDVIVGNSVILGKKLLALQIICSLFLAYIEIVISLAILGNTTLLNSWQIFAACIIVFITLFIMLRVKVKGEQKAESNENISDDTIVITRSEYNSLKQRISDLEEELIKLKTK